MKKLCFLNSVRRGGRLAAALLFCLSACGAGTVLAGGGAVVTSSPLGTSSLNWVKPNQKAEMPALQELVGTPSAKEAAPSAPIQNLDTAEEDLFLTDETETAEPIQPAIPALESIKQVRLLENPAEKPSVSPSPIKLAMATEEGPSAERAQNEKRLQNIYADECPDPHKMASILDMSYKVTISPGELPQSCPIPDELYVRKIPTPIVFTWKASALCHKPLYFEDVQLERYGHGICPLLQPALSGVRFWVTIPFLPYLMGTYPPTECVYDLGYYRPGSCAPNMIQPCPISLRGGLIEAGAIVGAAYAIP